MKHEKDALGGPLLLFSVQHISQIAVWKRIAGKETVIQCTVTMFDRRRQATVSTANGEEMSQKEIKAHF